MPVPILSAPGVLGEPGPRPVGKPVESSTFSLLFTGFLELPMPAPVWLVRGVCASALLYNAKTAAAAQTIFKCITGIPILA